MLQASIRTAYKLKAIDNLPRTGTDGSSWVTNGNRGREKNRPLREVKVISGEPFSLISRSRLMQPLSAAELANGMRCN